MIRPAAIMLLLAVTMLPPVLSGCGDKEKESDSPASVEKLPADKITPLAAKILGDLNEWEHEYGILSGDMPDNYDVPGEAVAFMDQCISDLVEMGHKPVWDMQAKKYVLVCREEKTATTTQDSR